MDVPPRSRRGCVSWTRVARTRTTRTTPARPRSSRCGTGTCGLSRSKITAGVAPVGASSSSAGRRPDPCDLSAACAARRDDRRRPATNLSVNTAVSALRRLRPTDTIGLERKRLATEFLDEVRRHDHALVELHRRIVSAVTAATTTVTDVFGVGPIVACYLIGYSGDIRRFPTAGHYARYNATAPIEASSGPRFAIGSTRTETGNSTMRSTSPRSARSATTHPAAPTTSANRPKGSRAKKRCVASNDGSATPSTDELRADTGH